MLCSLAGCAGNSRWADLKVEALAAVDGRPVRASTLWRIRSVQTFPPGARLEGSGVALAIPVAPGRYVYGLLRSLLKDDHLAGWDAFVTGVDAYAVGAGGRIVSEGDDWSETHDRVVAALRHREVELCSRDDVRDARDRCLVFVHFADPNDPASLMLIRPHEDHIVAGHRFRIDRVGAKYEAVGGTSRSQVAQLPTFVRDMNNRDFGTLPEDLRIASDRPLNRDDFWRKP